MKAKAKGGGDSGLAHWMREVPEQMAKAADGLESEAVHDLRVALRRCRTMAAGFRAIDPDKSWKKMRRQDTALFDSLGSLRDCHVQMEWVEKLAPENDPLTLQLTQHLQDQLGDLEQKASAAIDNFDLARWQEWTLTLPERAARLPLGSEAFQVLALEQLASARRLQSPALNSGGDVAFHRLRIGVKKFRYVVENFLPEQHQKWKDGLKRIQDLLGDIHDLDVLRQTVMSVSPDQPAEAREPWLLAILRERERRIAQYRESMLGKNSLWLQWRSDLPRGQAVRHASIQKLQAWSSFLDSDLQHSRRVSRFALCIHDGLSRLGVLDGNPDTDRELLRAASIVHEVGRAEGNKNHHKKTEKMVTEIDRLVGWKREEVNVMARVARYHRGALPNPSRLKDFPASQWRRITMLAGILRLANALDDQHDGAISSVTVEKPEGFVVIHAVGLAANTTRAERIAAARHLLETACGLPVLVQPARKITPRKISHPRRNTLPG